MSLENASLIVTANAFKAGKLYSVIPEDGSGDLDVVRASIATRVNENGIIESVSNNVPRLDYSNGTCPSWLIEPSATNLYLNSDTLSTQTNSTSATIYTISFYGTGTITFSGSFSGTLVGTGVDERVKLTFTASSGTLISTIVGNVEKAQLEEGSVATSYIPTLASTVTRVADSISKTGASALISQGSGTILFKALFDTPTEINVMGIIATVTNEQMKLTYSASKIELFANETSVGVLNGTFNFTGMDKIDLGNYEGDAQLNAHIQNFATI